jgi:hypothetical protein
MQRREVLRLLAGSAASVALAPLTPSERLELGAALHAETRAGNALEHAQRTLVSELAETILPRTGTPGALDAGVPEFIDRMLAWWFTGDERDQFVRGLAAIQARLTPMSTRTDVLAALDSASTREPGSAEDAWARLKSMTVYGYFTSKLVQEEVLHTVIMPGRYAGCVPVGR